MHAGQGIIQGLANRRISAPRNHFFSWWPACLQGLCSRSLHLCQFEFVSWRRSRGSEGFHRGEGVRGDRGWKAPWGWWVKGLGGGQVLPYLCIMWPTAATSRIGMKVHGDDSGSVERRVTPAYTTSPLSSFPTLGWVGTTYK